MKNFIVFVLLTISLSLSSQKVVIDGYAYETGNRGYLNTVEVKVYDDNMALLGTEFSDIDGHFVIEVPEKGNYKIVGSKDMFHKKELGIDRTASDAKVFVKLEMRRAPGYRFEITLANKRDDENQVVDAIKGADIEVYNNTQKEMVLTLEDYDDPTFEVPLLKENHYTLFVRKEGYLSKRMEAFVNVKDCLLCFEGVGEVRPGVADNLTEGNETGVLLANVEMEKIYPGKELRINNLYYETGSAEILSQAGAELDNLITILEDNPHLRVELGSHTDSKGLQEKNLILSQKRAQKAVEYIVSNSNVSKNVISWRGYGETKLLNDCTSFVDCTDAEHAKNRRTEITVLGIDPNIAPISLAKRVAQDEEENLINQLMNQEQVKVTGDEKPSFLDEQSKKSEIEEKIEMKEPDLNKKMEQPMQSDQKQTTEQVSDKVKMVKESVVTEEVGKVKEAISTESQVVKNEISKGETGTYFTIIYFFSRVNLADDHKARNVEDYMERKDKSGNLLYHVGKFETEVEAIQFLNERIRPMYKSAYISKLIDGKFSS